MKQLLAGVGLVAIGVAAGVFLLQGPRPSAQSEMPPAAESLPAAIEDAAAVLQAAHEQAPYAIREPDWLPAGYELRRVSFDSDPGAAEGHAFSVDLKYVNANDEVIHVWQTNLTPEQLGPTDPLEVAGSTPLGVVARPGSPPSSLCSMVSALPSWRTEMATASPSPSMART